MMAVNDMFSAEMVNTASVGDLAALQKELTRLTAATDPKGGLKNTVVLALGMLHRYATGIVHVDTGRLKNSIFFDDNVQGNDVFGYVATNVSYSIWEEKRGGSHAFFQRTVTEEGPHVNDLFFKQITGGQR